jgi:hypothetical protein
MRRKTQPKVGWNDEISDTPQRPAPSATPDQVQREIAEATKEATERVGMSGALGNVKAGGIRIDTAGGVNAYQGGERKTSIEPDGDFFAGSNINIPAGTSFIVFAVAQDWNGEAMEEGDILIGDNSDDTSNIKWDASEGQWQFRLGTTVNVYMDTDGTVKFGGGDGWLDVFGLNFRNQEGEVAFEDTSGNIGNLSIYSDAFDDIVIKNSVGGAATGVRFDLDDASHNVGGPAFTYDGIYLYTGNYDGAAGTQYLVDGSPHTHGTSELTNVASGTYTPTLTLVTNLDAALVSADFTYIRVGNIVHVEGGITADATAAGNTVVGISLPIASNFAGNFDATGIGSNQLSNVTGNIQADTTNDRAQLTYQAIATTSQAFRVSFNYQII